MKRVVLVWIAVMSACLLGTQLARADTYNVSATVPYDTPSTAATFASSLSGLNSPTRVVHLNGTCQYVYPASIVAIYRQGILIGSTACAVANIYQLDVSLQDGQNALLARTYNMNGIYGPDSAVITISYTPPAVVTPGVTPQAVIQNASSDLSIVTQSPFQVVDATHKTVRVSVIVDGGTTPYTIELNWGDGAFESKQVSTSGTYTFEHEYAKPATYQAKARVTDVLGASREQSFVVVSPGPLAEASSGQPTKVVVVESAKKGPPIYWYIFGGLVSLGIGILIGVLISRHRKVGIARKRRKKK